MKHNPKTKVKEPTWDYVFSIERRFKNRFAYYGKKCLIWATFACCRSIHKDIEAHITEEFLEENKTEAKPENTRGDGYQSP